MGRFKEILAVNAVKIFRRPLYCAALVLLGLPVHFAALLLYLKRRRAGGWLERRRRILQDLGGSGEARSLREQVERQLRNKLAFLGKAVSERRFAQEAAALYGARLAERADEEMLRRYGDEEARPVRYVSVFTGLLNHPASLVFFCVAGLPMTLVILVYGGAYAKYIFERVMMMVFVIFGVTFLVFSILYMSPLDAARNILGPTATAEQIGSFNHIYGLDQSYPAQLVNKFKNLLTFNLGKTYMGNEDVFQAILRKFPVTLQVTFYSLLLALLIALPAGIVSAVRPNTISDYLLMFVALLGLSIPNFWLGLMLINEFSIQNALLPATYSPENGKSLIMPAIVLGTGLSATVTRMTRSSLLEVINQDYIVTARAKGLSSRRVIMGHALPNAMIPIVTVVGLQFGAMLGGAAVTEKVFNINGIGKYVVDKQFVPDIPVVLAGVVYIAIVISLVNLGVDILYTFLDPRIKSKLKNY
ncbi:MAG: ABC transporter permease [Treponema sp.]|jgi:peptide/nickel transport system permease protein|nr:ABC transporter permease [Treponema sp.]